MLEADHLWSISQHFTTKRQIKSSTLNMRQVCVYVCSEGARSVFGQANQWHHHCHPVVYKKYFTLHEVLQQGSACWMLFGLSFTFKPRMMILTEFSRKPNPCFLFCIATKKIKTKHLSTVMHIYMKRTLKEMKRGRQRIAESLKSPSTGLSWSGQSTFSCFYSLILNSLKLLYSYKNMLA